MLSIAIMMSAAVSVLPPCPAGVVQDTIGGTTAKIAVSPPPMPPLEINGAPFVTPLPDYLQGLEQHILPVDPMTGMFPLGTHYKLECSACCPECTFYIVVYHCPSCSTPINGGLPAIATAKGWEVRNCGPKFMHAGFPQPTNVYKIKLLGGVGSEIFQLTKDAHFVAIFSGKSVDAVPDWCPLTNLPHGPQPTAECLQHCF